MAGALQDPAGPALCPGTEPLEGGTLISERLAAGEEVKLTGFGNFNTRMKAPRPGRNLHTGETVPIAARRVVTFHASQRLKEAVQQAQSSDGGR